MAGDDAVHKVTLSRPVAGETVQITVHDGWVYLLDFDLGATTVAENGKDVTLTFDDGSGMVLHNFFSAARAGDFYLTLPDGAVLSGRDMVDTLTFSLDKFHPSDGLVVSDAEHEGGASLNPDPEAASGAGPFLALFSPCGHGKGPSLGEVLDIAPPAGAGADDLDSLLPPPATPHQPPLPGGCQEAGGAAFSGSGIAAHPDAFSIGSGDGGQEQHLLAHLLLLSL